MATEVDDFLAHVGVKGMKWGKRKAATSGDSGSAPKKAPSAGKQRDMDIKAARGRVNEGKNLVGKILNADSFGKPLGGHQMLSLMNPGKSPQDVALASRMTRGQKAALAVTAGLSVAGLALSAAGRA